MKDEVICSSKSTFNLVLPVVILVVCIYFGMDTVRGLLTGTGNRNSNLLFLFVYLIILVESIRLLMVYFNRKIVVSKDGVRYTSHAKSVIEAGWDKVTVAAVGSNKVLFNIKGKQVVFTTKDSNFHNLVVYLRKNGKFNK